MDNLSNFKIFVIDDDKDDYEFLLQAIVESKKDIEVTYFSRPDIFLGKLDTIKVPSLIVMDVNMPKLSGFDLYPLVRKNVRFEHVPIVYLTTSTNEDTHKQAIDLGAIACLVKPPSLEEWKDIVATLVEVIK
jgi:DNA-binding response OmpR family regulator